MRNHIKNNMVKWLLALVFIPAASPCLKAQFTQPYNVVTADYSALTCTGSGCDITADYWELSGLTSLEYRAEKAVLELKLSTGEKHQIGPDDGNFTYELPELTIDVIDNSANTLAVYTVDEATLTIDQHNVEMHYVLDITSIVNTSIADAAPDKLDYIKISWDASTCAGCTIATTPYDPVLDGFLQNNITLDAQITVEHAIDVRDASLTTVNPICTIYTPQLTNRLVDLDWTGSCGGSNKIYPNYQVQVLKVENQLEQNLNSGNVTATVDWNNALTLETQSDITDVTFTVAEGTGLYIWRVRPIGDFHEGGIANSLNHGAWNSGPPAQGATINLNPQSLDKWAFYYIDSEEDINWIYSRTFTEGNHLHEQISYAGQLYNQKQTQSKLSSDHTVVASQTIQDFTGRDAVQTAPVPLTGVDELSGYKPQLVEPDNSDPQFDPRHFDKGNNVFDPIGVDNTGEYGYYSENNGDHDVPDAQKYPYTRTLFFNDGSGTLRETSGMGKIHAIGTTSDKGKTTKYFYGSPSDDELIRIFGNEAPSASSVYKSITIDPNGTASVTYTSKEGHVIATSLMDHAEDAVLEELDGLTAQDRTYTNKNSITNNYERDGMLIASKRMAFVDDEIVILNYDFDCAPPGTPCLPTATWPYEVTFCAYEAHFRVYHIESGHYWISNTVVLGDYCPTGQVSSMESNLFWEEFEPGNQTPISSGALPMPLNGNYIFEKRLKPMVNIAEEVEKTVDGLKAQAGPIMTMLESQLPGISSNDDLYAFYTHMIDLSSAINAAHTSNDYVSLANSYSQYFPANAGWNPNEQDDVDQNFSQLDFDITMPQSGEIPESFTVQTMCCGAITVNVDFQPQYTCPDLEQVDLGTPHQDLDFEGFLSSRLSEYISNTGSLIYGNEGLLQGFNTGEFNTMIRYMLKSPAPECGNYECDDLWKCWIGVVSNYENMLTDINPGHPADSADDRNGNSSEVDNTVDDESEESSEGGWLANWLAKRAMSKRMRDDVDIDQDVVRINLVEQFMSCAGYKFEDILHNGGTPTIAQDANIYDPNNLNAYDGQGKMIYPYVRDPRFVYKYFDYDVSLTNAFSAPDEYKRKVQAELQHCYSLSPPCPNMCDAPDCESDHDEWNCQQRYDFYIHIKTMVTPKVSSLSSWLEVESGCPPNNYDMTAKFNNLWQRALDAITDQEQEIWDDIEAAFLENCYVIGGCPEDGVITPEEITAIRDQVVTDMTAQVNGIFTNADALNYPKHASSSCTYLDDNLMCQTFERCRIILLPECDWNMIHVLINGQFEMSRDFVTDTKLWEAASGGTLTQVSALPTGTTCATQPPVEPSTTSGWEITNCYHNDSYNSNSSINGQSQVFTVQVTVP